MKRKQVRKYNDGDNNGGGDNKNDYDKTMTMRASMRQRVIRHGLAAILAASPILPKNRYGPFSYLLSLLLLCVRRIKQNGERCVINC